jgi:DNA N-6-adenine-methyltransferase (Dam)
MTAGRQVLTQNKDWCTPPKYVEAIREFFEGTIHLDPCSNGYSIVNATVEYNLPKKDGLRESWNFSTIYVNPPYGIDQKHGTAIRDWLQRCEEANRQYGSEVIALVPVATNTGHWKKYVYGKATAVCFLYDTRLRFLVNGKNGGTGAPMSCALIYWGNKYQRFFESFLKFGAVINIENLKGQIIGQNGNGNQVELEMQ